MSGFRYSAYDLNGRELRGVLESDSLRLARAQLREKGLFPLEVTPIADNTGATRLRRNRTHLGISDLARVTRQLATLLGAGLTIEHAFNALVEQAEAEGERQLLAAVRSQVLEGQALGQALGAFPQTFSTLYQTLITAGETSGKLPQVLMRLADHVEDQQALRQKLMVAMIYPVIVMMVCLLVVAGLMLYVVPQIISVFEATKQTLPLMTRALLWLSTFLQKTGWFWLLLAIGGGIGARIALRRVASRRRFHALLLGLPWVGRLIRSRESAQLAATLAILTGSGVPVLSALQAGAGVVNNLPMKEALQRATHAVREGSAVARALAQQQTRRPLFPPVMVHLIASGEASGQLSDTLQAAARQQQRDVETRTAAFAAIIEPAMIVIMGLIVLAIVLAVLLPIFQLNQLVAR